MSVCDSCIKAKPVARCLTNLIVGTIANVNTAIFVYITDLTTERRIRYSVTTDSDGLITIPITPQRFSDDHSYRLHVTLVNAINVSEEELITVGEETNNCISLRFLTIWKNDNTIATYTDQTLAEATGDEFYYYS